MTETHRWIGALSGLFGAWLLVSAFVFGMVGAHFWNDVIVGAAILVLAWFSAAQAESDESANMWASGLAALLGLWTIASPFVYGSTGAAMWSSLVTGVLVAVLSGYNAFEAGDVTGAASTSTTGS